MSALLSVDGPVYRSLNGWWWLVKISAIWFVGCLPVVTAPVSTLWLIDSAQRQLAGRRPVGRTEALTLLKDLTWPALRLFALHAAALAVLLSAALGPSPGGVFDVVLPASAACAGATWLLLMPWSLALLVRRRRGAIDAITRAYLAGIGSPLLAAACVLGLAACAAVVVMVPDRVLLLVLPTVPGLAACLLVATLNRAGLTASHRFDDHERSDR